MNALRTAGIGNTCVNMAQSGREGELLKLCSFPVRGSKNISHDYRTLIS